MPLIGFAIRAVAIAIVGILIGIVYVLAVSCIAAADKVRDAMRPRIIRIHAYAPARTPLNGEHKAVIILRSSGCKLAKPSDLILESRIQEAECATVLSVVECGAGRAWSDLIVGRPLPFRKQLPLLSPLPGTKMALFSGCEAFVWMITVPR